MFGARAVAMAIVNSVAIRCTVTRDVGQGGWEGGVRSLDLPALNLADVPRDKGKGKELGLGVRVGVRVRVRLLG
jgi:hypothetical protein